MQYLDSIFKTAGGHGISRYVLGSSGFGGRKSEELSFRQLDMYFRYGGNVLDSAAVYGESEKTIGKYLKSGKINRSDVIIITKGAHPHGESMHTPRMSADDIEFDIEKSFRDLGTDYIDIYYLHRDAPDIPAGAIIDILNKYVKEGRVRSLGASNWTAKRVNEANKYAAENNLAGFSFSQICCNAAVITPEEIGDDTLVCMNSAEYDEYIKNQIPIMAYSSQAEGFFQKFAFCGAEKISGKYASEENIARLHRIENLSREKDVSVTAIVGAYLTSKVNKVTILPIIGASSEEQLEDTLKNQGFELGEEEISYINGY